MWLIGTQRPSPAQVKCASWYRNWLQKSVIKNIIIILLATQTTFVDNCCSKFHPHFLVLSSVQSCTSVPSSALFHYHIRFDLKICGFVTTNNIYLRSDLTCVLLITGSAGPWLGQTAVLRAYVKAGVSAFTLGPTISTQVSTHVVLTLSVVAGIFDFLMPVWTPWIAVKEI